MINIHMLQLTRKKLQWPLQLSKCRKCLRLVAQHSDAIQDVAGLSRHPYNDEEAATPMPKSA
eukprot:6192053-Pleurochrysis_carterae.AAC.3